MDTKTILATLTRAMLASTAGALVHHGVMQSSGTEAFIGAGMLAATGAWGLWNGYGKDIAKASLELLRARVLAAAARAQAAPALAPQALASVAAHVEATTPVAAPASPATPLATTGLVLAIALLAWAGPAGAQGVPRPPPRLTGDPVKDIGSAIHPDIPAQSAETVVNKDLLDKLNDKLLTDILADVTYASARAHVVDNKVTIPCWDAWLALLTLQSAPLKDGAGNVLTKPDPHVITSAEFASEILRQLQPDSTISLGCGSMLQAIKKDVATMVGAVLSGGALGLFKLPIAFP